MSSTAPRLKRNHTPQPLPSKRTFISCVLAGYDKVYLYAKFTNLDDFHDVLQYAKDSQYYVWHREEAEPARCKLCVKADAHMVMKKYIKQKKAQRAAGSMAH